MATRESQVKRKAPAKKIGRPRRAKGLERRQFVVDVELLERIMRRTGKNQSEVVNEALAKMDETAYILEGLESIRGMYPDFPDPEHEV